MFAPSLLLHVALKIIFQEVAEDLTESEEGTKDEGPKAPQDIVMDAVMGVSKHGSIRKEDFEKSEL